MSTRNRIWKWDAKQGKVVEVLPDIPPDVDAPFIQDDTIPPTISHATDEGLVFESRSALYEHYRQNGFECTGGSHLTGKGVFDRKYKSDPREIRADVAESLRQLKWGMAPMTEKEREICQREETNYSRYQRQR